MNKKIPGTTLRYNEQAKLAAYSVVAPVIEATGGLTLSQLSKLTGLEGSTIQNWIKRGWVSTTVGKKYSDKQVIRILLINMLYIKIIFLKLTKAASPRLVYSSAFTPAR